jgi:hypothetical protein
MKQHESVIKVMEENGGYATLRFLNQNVLKVEGVQWKTKTPFASIRRIVQDERFFFKIRPGLWALKSFKDKLPLDIFPSEDQPKEKHEEYSHTFYQGLLVELGNFNKYETFIPNQDKNKIYLGRKISEIATLSKIHEYSYRRIVGITKTIDVIWFNQRNMPSRVFEVEHTTAIHKSLLKFVELQDFYIKFYIVADEVRRKEFQIKLSLEAFYPICKRVRFWSYDDVAELHAKTNQLINIESKLENNCRGKYDIK